MSKFIEDLAQRLARRTVREIEIDARDQAAIAVILAPAANDAALDLLLIERALFEGDPWSGHMALPGGRREAQDLDLRATAVRETREEIGVDLERARLLGRLDDLRPIRQTERALAVRPFVYWASERPTLELSPEIADVLWVSLGALGESAGEADVLHRGAHLRVPAYLLDKRAVWGMTHRVLSGLLELARGD